MSLFDKNREIGEMNRMDFVHADEEDDYVFQYIPEMDFKRIAKNVQRQRCQEEEERLWNKFVKEQENIRPCVHAVNDVIREGMEAVDRELERLQEDALPEGRKIHSGNISPSTNTKFNEQVSQYCPIINSPNRRYMHPKKSAREINTLSLINVPPGSTNLGNTNTRKSSSDPSLIPRQRQNFSNELQNDWSTPRWSARENTVEEDNVSLRVDPLTMHRIAIMRIRIGKLLDEIVENLRNIPSPDGENDLNRRHQRAMEFAIRFSRNYLYDLSRFATSIRMHLTAVSPRPGLKLNPKYAVFHREMIDQKLITAHQLLIQALTAYCKHIPKSLLQAQRPKLRQLLEIVLDLNEICEKITVSSNYFASGNGDALQLGNELQSKCDTIFAKLKHDGKDSQIKVRRQTQSANVIGHRGPVVPVNNKSSRRNSSSNRLSMYNVIGIKVSKTDQAREWRCHREKEKRCQFISKKALLADCYFTSDKRMHSSGGRNLDESVKSTNCSKEDDVKTMMDAIEINSENQGSNVDGSGEYRKIITEEIRIPEVRDLENEVRNGKTENMNEEGLANKFAVNPQQHLSTLVPVIADLMSLISNKKHSEMQISSDAPVETLSRVSQGKSPKERGIGERNQSRCVRSKSKGNRTTIEKNTKNIQLICVSSKDDVVNPRYDVSCQANYENLRDENKMSNSPRETELTISGESVRNFLAYRRKYRTLCQSKPMYCSKTQNKPWDVVVWISEKLVEELIIEMAQELQINNVIQKLFELEFQEF